MTNGKEENEIEVERFKEDVRNQVDATSIAETETAIEEDAIQETNDNVKLMKDSSAKGTQSKVEVTPRDYEETSNSATSDCKESKIGYQ